MNDLPSGTRTREKFRTKRSWDRSGRLRAEELGFRCAHCRAYVSTDPFFSGVGNRNHCPYCLWSRHLDSQRAGDRLSACKEPMRPVGLALKRTFKKYARENAGELMVVHVCTGCGKAAINRIAADDDAETLLEAFAASNSLEPPLLERLEAQGIQVLGARDRSLVQARLLGNH